ncbi:putative holin-like toxin [Streptococcus porcinus]|nr:putative holin-like toxin [Streptococcus porcinus]
MIYKALELMHSFGGFILTLIGIIIAIVNLSKKNNCKLYPVRLFLI